MSKIKLSIIALSCVMALSACSSSSKGGTDNSEQIRQLESDLSQKIAELSKKAESNASKSSMKAVKTNLTKAKLVKLEQKGRIHIRHLQILRQS